MKSNSLPKFLRLLFFFIGVGASISSGIYIQKVTAGDFSISDILKAGAFLLLGICSMIMYGKNR